MTAQKTKSYKYPEGTRFEIEHSKAGLSSYVVRIYPPKEVESLADGFFSEKEAQDWIKNYS